MAIKTFLPFNYSMPASIIIYVIALTFLASGARATNYYVSAKGNDASDGLSPRTSWLTIAKINRYKFSPGDSILFKRGDAWREGHALYGTSDGAPGNHIVFSCYGTGEKPLLLASKVISSRDYWTLTSEMNIWKTTSKINITSKDLDRMGQITPDVASLIFDNEKSVGVKKRFLKDLKVQGDFSLNLEDTILYMYSAIHPSKRYKKIEATGIRNCENNIEVINGHYITFLNLDIRYSKNNGLFLQSCSNIEIIQCDFSWIGGCYFPIQTFMNSSRPNPGRMGNAVQLWKGNADVTVKFCNINQVYDAGISPQGVGSIYKIHNLRFHHNLINNCFYSFEFWGHEPGSTGDSIFFENNTCLNAGNGWSTIQRPDKVRCAHLQFSTSKMAFSNVFIRNNIFDESVCFCSDGAAESDGSNTDAVWAAFTMDYNCYFKSYANEKPVIRWRGGAAKGGGDFFIGDLKMFQKASGKEYHSKFEDIKMTSKYTLQPDSPAIDAGIDIGYPFVGSAPDMGAFEYVKKRRGAR